MKETKFKQTEIGKIPEDWETKTIGELGKIITGKTPSTFEKSNFGEDYPFVTPSDMSGQKHIFSTQRYLSEQGKSSMENSLLPAGSVFVSCIGSDMGKISMTTTESLTNQQINSIIPENFDNNFIYYSLLNISPEIKNLGKQSTAIPILNKTQFSQIEINVPKSKEEQHAIAQILSSLDAKIELNNKMNKTLEAIGQAIFKKWFVDEAKGEWEIGKLREFGEVICGKTPPTSIKDYFGGKIPFIKIPDMHNNLFILKTTETLTEEGKHFQLNKIIPKGAICVSCIATIGLVSITTEESQTNQQINSIIPREDFAQGYLYYSLKDFKKKLKDIGSGGAVTLNVNTTLFSDIEIIIPDDKTLQNFNKLIKPVFKQISTNCFQNQTLSQIRDALLPKLMSGEMRVN